MNHYLKLSFKSYRQIIDGKLNKPQNSVYFFIIVFAASKVYLLINYCIYVRFFFLSINSNQVTCNMRLKETIWCIENI